MAIVYMCIYEGKANNSTTPRTTHFARKKIAALGCLVRLNLVRTCVYNNHEKNGPQALSPVTTSSLLKLANHSGEICTHVSQHFHDDH